MVVTVVKKKKINFTLKEIFCGSYSLGLFSAPTYNSHAHIHFTIILVILESKFSLVTHVYIKTIYAESWVHVWTSLELEMRRYHYHFKYD